jgi:hypothetical protein
MKQLLCVCLVLLARPLAAAPDAQWTLVRSTLTYHVSHPLHQMEGVSHAARGKAVCAAGECEVLVAVPLRSFDSGDTNRDLHMQQAVRAATFPMVTVRTKVPENGATSGTIHADLDVEFAGETAHYKQVPFQVTSTADETRITGTIPATLFDFKIDPPSLLTMPIKNQIPVMLEMTWKKSQ